MVQALFIGGVGRGSIVVVETKGGDGKRNETKRNEMKRKERRDRFEMGGEPVGSKTELGGEIGVGLKMCSV